MLLEQQSDCDSEENHISGNFLEGFESRLFLRPSAFFDDLSAMLDFVVGSKLEGKEDTPYDAGNDQREAGFHRISQLNDCSGIVTGAEISVQLSSNRSA